MQLERIHGTHDLSSANRVHGVLTGHFDTEFTYTFDNFFHPFVGELIARLNRESLPGMLDATWQASLKTPDPVADAAHDYFNILYQPGTDLVEVVHFPKEIDVSSRGAYSNYNWELLFHIPLTVAVHLSKSQRFAEAQRWFHYIFDPTCTENIPAPKRFWRFLAFRNPDGARTIDEVLRLLSSPRSELSHADQLAQDDVVDGYDAIRNKPFQPHAVARTRHVAYQYCVVMKYLDNLIDWGDHLFQQDTVESINEASQRYVLAANILGARPQRIPSSGITRPMTFAELKTKTKGLGPIGNALVELEGQFPFNIAAPSSGGDGGSGSALFGIGQTLYFCTPRNDKMLGYWDLVADRLFKIRHCMNIEGVVRPLALFDPPIDPGMLVKAAAAGIDIGSIVNGLNQPVGPVRSLTLIQKAVELCAEVRSLGGALLTAVEKGDAEHLALVRQGHEITMQELAQDVRFLQWKAAEEGTKSLLTARATALSRLRFYARVLGLPPDPNAPETIALDRRPLTEDNFDESYAALVGQYDKPVAEQQLPPLLVYPQGAPTALGALSPGKLYLNLLEGVELNVLLPVARDARLASSALDLTASIIALIPDFDVKLAFWGTGAASRIFGGIKLHDMIKGMGDILRIVSAFSSDMAGMAARGAAHERRADDWIMQYNNAAHELMQNGRQILTSLIAEQIARHEYENVKTQIENAREVDRLMHEKFSNEDLYLWMQGEISRLYYEYYRFAFDVARKAERTMKQELMRPELDSQDFVKFNYWDGGRKGLLSGEALHLDVKRMEMAYHDNNKRELELTRHVSLRQLDPLALLSLKATGSCTATIPEWLFDLDCPGHYMRRIKSVALSLPAVVGPYASVNCTLSLLRSSVRKSPLPRDNAYARQGAEDDRFVDYAGAVQSIVTSSGNNDSGLFEANLRDERFLPFEGAGAESTWKLDLPNPADFPTFDYATISDAILHIRYTARQGVDSTLVRTSLADLLSSAAQSNLALLFSLRHDFSTEWAAFLAGADFSAAIRKTYFPYFVQGAARTITVQGLEIYDGGNVGKHHAVGNPATATTDLAAQGRFTLTAAADAAGPTQVLARSANAQPFLILRYSI